MFFLLIPETEFHLLQVRPVFLIHRCMPFHLTVLKHMHECVLAKGNNLPFIVATSAMSAKFTCFASVPVFFQIVDKVSS